MADAFNQSNPAISHSRIANLTFLFTLILVGFGFLQVWLLSGTFCYALDDSFIMMAISRNLAFHGVWGLTSHEFSSTASSPAFTVLLAIIIKIIGDHIWIPLVINILTLFGLLHWLSKRANEWNLQIWQTWFLMVGMVLLAPVPVLIFGSMEHILHLWLALICLYRIVEKKPSPPLFWLFVFGLCLGGIRFEGLFEGGLLVLYLWSEKKWFSGFVFGLGLIIPITALGLYSMSQGWFFLPNSLILKAYHLNVQETGTAFGYLYSLLHKASYNTHAIAAIFLLFLAKNEKSFPKGPAQNWLLILIWASIAHFIFARYSHVYRYEAYLMGMTWIAFWRSLCQSGSFPDSKSILNYLSRNKEMAALIIVLSISPLYRSVKSYVAGTIGMVNIYEQQVQTARFVKQFYNHSPIAAIDIGALAYYTDSPILDLWGLGSLNMAKLKIAGNYNNQTIDSACRKANVEAILYYGEKVNFDRWIKAGTWIIQDNMVCAEDTIDFYGLTPDGAQKLQANLRNFEAELPKRVLVQYVDQKPPTQYP